MPSSAGHKAPPCDWEALPCLRCCSLPICRTRNMTPLHYYIVQRTLATYRRLSHPGDVQEPAAIHSWTSESQCWVCFIMPPCLKAQLHRHLFLVAMPLSGVLLRRLLGLEALPEVTSRFITDNFVKCESEIEDRKVSSDVGRESMNLWVWGSLTFLKNLHRPRCIRWGLLYG